MLPNNNATRLKRSILAEVAKLALKGRLEAEVEDIPARLAPKGSVPHRCCIYHDREIIRFRILAQLGFAAESGGADVECPSLSRSAAQAFSRKRRPGLAPEQDTPLLSILDEACHACVRAHYLVTDACQACVARPCAMNCPKRAVTIQKGRAIIDADLCVNCGICQKACPYHAIVKIPVPCEEACPVEAIRKDENGMERIDFDKCVFCGACMRDCPFGAVVDVSSMVDVARLLRQNQSDRDEDRSVALFSPASAVQFRASPGKFASALKSLGFSEAVEVALGADMTAKHEAEELAARIKKDEGFLATSCCPAWARTAELHLPAYAGHVSATDTPLAFTARFAREEFPGATTVFISPCLAKRAEARENPDVDYVITIEELGALFMAASVETGDCETAEDRPPASAEGRGFAAAGGVAAAVLSCLQGDIVANVKNISGISRESLKELRAFAANPNGVDLLEVMSCEGGCIGGPQTVTNPKVALAQLKSPRPD